MGVKGGVVIVKDISKPGDFGDLRCEKERIVISSNCPQEHYPSRWQSYSDLVDH